MLSVSVLADVCPLVDEGVWKCSVCDFHLSEVVAYRRAMREGHMPYSKPTPPTRTQTLAYGFLGVSTLLHEATILKLMVFLFMFCS